MAVQRRSKLWMSGGVKGCLSWGVSHRQLDEDTMAWPKIATPSLMLKSARFCKLCVFLIRSLKPLLTEQFLWIIDFGVVVILLLFFWVSFYILSLKNHSNPERRPPLLGLHVRSTTPLSPVISILLCVCLSHSLSSLVATCCGTVSFSHKKVAGWSLFWQAGTPDVAFAGLCIAIYFVFGGKLSCVPNVRLLFRFCCCNRKFAEWFYLPFLLPFR